MKKISVAMWPYSFFQLLLFFPQILSSDKLKIIFAVIKQCVIKTYKLPRHSKYKFFPPSVQNLSHFYAKKSGKITKSLDLVVFWPPSIRNIRLSHFCAKKSRKSLEYLATEAIAPPFRTAFAHPLGPTDPCSTAVHMEPFSTSAFKALV